MDSETGHGNAFPVAGIPSAAPSGQLPASTPSPAGQFPPVSGLRAAAVFNPMLSVGHQLMQARQARGLTIEDVAFETRIPHHRLREMENDDLSNFANLTYAKGFLKLYSRFLQLDLSEYLDEFDTSAVAEATGHAYARFRFIRTETVTVMASEPPRSGGGRSALILTVFLVSVLGGALWLIFKDRLGSPHENTSASSAPQTQSPAPDSPPPGIAAPARPAPAPARSAAAAPLPHPDASPALESLPPPAEPQIPRATRVDEDGNDIPPRAEPAD